jgi:ribosomal protein S18 acetylase RimI-like enzyme
MHIDIVSAEKAPLALLLNADPSIDVVQKYLQTGTVFVGQENGTIVAVAVLDRDSEGKDVELKNLSVAEDRQGQGLGRQMLAHVLDHAAKTEKATRVVVGTGNSTFQALAFYQRNGFRITGVIPNFFDEYIPAIVEDGIACRDMVRLALDLPRQSHTTRR